MAGFAPAYPRSPPRHGTRPLSLSGLATASNYSSGFLRLAFLTLHRITVLAAPRPTQRRRPKPGDSERDLLPTDKFRVTKLYWMSEKVLRLTLNGFSGLRVAVDGSMT